jgi:hypothetical protein
MVAVPLFTSVHQDGNLLLTYRCAPCGGNLSVNGVDRHRFELWRAGLVSAELAFPDLGPGQIKTLISGSHEACSRTASLPDSEETQ